MRPNCDVEFNCSTPFLNISPLFDHVQWRISRCMQPRYALPTARNIPSLEVSPDVAFCLISSAVQSRGTQKSQTCNLDEGDDPAFETYFLYKGSLLKAKGSLKLIVNNNLWSEQNPDAVIRSAPWFCCMVQCVAPFRFVSRSAYPSSGVKGEGGEKYERRDGPSPRVRVRRPEEAMPGKNQVRPSLGKTVPQRLSVLRNLPTFIQIIPIQCTKEF